MKLIKLTVPTTRGNRVRDAIEVPGCSGLVVSIFDDGGRNAFTPTVRSNGFAIAYPTFNKAAAIAWCKWLWLNLPEGSKSCITSGVPQDEMYKQVLEPEGAREVLKLARKMSDENWSAKRIKASKINEVGQ
jgi:hypothetical protein